MTLTLCHKLTGDKLKTVKSFNKTRSRCIESEKFSRFYIYYELNAPYFFKNPIITISQKRLLIL